MTRHRLFVLAAVGSLAAAPARADFVPYTYFPLAVGNSWTFDEDDLEIVEGDCAANSFTAIGDGTECFTNDASGLQLWEDTVEALGVYADVTFDPPILLSPAHAPAGTKKTTKGTLVIHIAGYGDYPLSYTATATIQSATPVVVPAGSFSTYPLKLDLSVNGSVEGETVKIKGTSTTWWAECVGQVKSNDALFGGDPVVKELQSYSVQPLPVEPCPEPGGQASLAAVLALAGLAVERGTNRALGRWRRSDP